MNGVSIWWEESAARLGEVREVQWMSSELIDRARAGDPLAFEQLVFPYRHELQVHCYRLLGSMTDAEDGLQETLIAAWRAIGEFQGRASIRTWLYKIATNRCLNMLRAAGRRPAAQLPPLGVDWPEASALGEVAWLEPYPDLQLASQTSDGPEARYEAREAISLAFITALQLLPPRQRSALILRDVLDFSAREVAEILDTTQDAVASALKRARATISREMPTPNDPPPAPDSAAERHLLSKLVRAFEDANVGAIVALMTEDAWVRMPPVPLEYRGRESAGAFFSSVAFRDGRRYRLVPARANGQPAYGVYLYDPSTGEAQAFGLFVITLAGERVSAITRFDAHLFPRFGLPQLLPE